MEHFDHQEIEKNWQRRWADEHVFSVTTPSPAKAGATPPHERRGQYVLDMFPYPSGDGLHVGHPEGYTATDIYARYLRMKGVAVMHPMGWDAFGLPAENYAIKMGVHPADVTAKNIANFKRQIQSLGFSYDWSREVNTTDPKYYKWTQWIFLQLYKRNLAYEKESPIWWCPKDKTGLANEEVVNGKCDRCGSVVEKKMLRQWMLKITAYADRLLYGLNNVDWPEGIKTLQRNWMGKSEGAEVDFMIDDHKVTVFTTRPDTLFGATYLVLAPEHELVKTITTLKQKRAVEKYAKSVAAKSDLERTSLEKEKTGVFTGAYTMNPLNNEKIPVWIADYVLASYGTGAIMAVPAHDERDFAFATKFKLSITNVVRPETLPFTLLIHGITGHSKENWFPWFKENMEKIGWDVATPDMPDTKRPTVEKWNESLQQFNNKVNENTIFIGHSLGAPAVLNYLQSVGTKVSKVILVAPTSPVPDWNKFSKVVPEVDWKIADKFNKGIVFNWDRINKLAGEFIVYYSDNDPYIKKENIDFYKKYLPKADFRLLKGRYHFDEYHGIKEFPELLDDYVQCWGGEGTMINSGEFDGLTSADGRKKIVARLEKEGQAKFSINYKLRDWVFSRQRYWGEPIPLVHCKHCGVVLVPEDQLPVLLPDVKKYEPTGTGESPLAGIDLWVNVKCPKCNGSAKRETNTMPQWAGSCWYYLRYLDPHNDKALASPEAMKAWLPVDMYVGGAEHAVLHLLYARFWHKVLFDAGIIPKECGDEPFVKLKNQGLILGPDGEKMSKSRGNVINPDEIIEKYGADTLRMYEMFMGPFEDAKPWDTNGILGVRRFLEKVWRAGSSLGDSSLAGQLVSSLVIGDEIRMHRYTKLIGEGIDNFRFNTCVSDFMKWANEWSNGEVSKDEFVIFLKLLNPFAPHITEELWSILGNKTVLAQEKWPEYDSTKIANTNVTIAIQVMGKLRATITMPTGSDQSLCEAKAKQETNVVKYLTSEPKKVIFVKDKLINFVT